MTEPKAPRIFEFVDVDPAKPRPDDVRRRVRKQAMLHAFADKKKRGGWIKYNMVKAPREAKSSVILSKSTTLPNATCQKHPFEHNKDDGHSQNTNLESMHPDSSPPDPTEQHHEFILQLPRPNPPDDYTMMRLESQFDILSLSVLTGCDIGRCTMRFISKRPNELRPILQTQQKLQSYLHYIPSRYGTSDCLDAAIKCLAHKAKDIVYGNSSESSNRTVALYGTALSRLNEALCDKSKQLETEVLAASTVLMLVELIDAKREFGWVQHVAGAARLLQLRGPLRFGGEFEKALFAGIFGAITLECMLNNKRSFLENAEWEPVFDSLIDNRCGRAQTVALWKLFVSLPGVLADVTELVCYSRHAGKTELDRVAAKLQLKEQRYLNWKVEFENHLRTDAGLHTPANLRHELDAVFLAGTVLVRRLHAAVSSQARAEDAQTANIALHLLAMEGKLSVASSVKTFFLPQKSKIALATVATTEEWQSHKPTKTVIPNCPESELVDPELFINWCAMWGKTTKQNIMNSPSEYQAFDQMSQNAIKAAYVTTLPTLSEKFGPQIMA